MTSARRACLAVIAAAALALTAAAAGHHVPARHLGASGRLTATARPGGPIVRVSLLPAAAAAAAARTIANTTSVASLNWAGYAVSGHRDRFASIQATFFVPFLTCSKSLGKTLSSDWVGLDGFVGKPDSVEQGGVGADCSAGGKASYYTWWEMYPAAETKASLRVKPGDSVTASISYSSAHKDFRITLADHTSGGHFALTRRCPDIKIGKRAVVCPRNSAEVISEAPAIGTSASTVSIAHLSDYDAVSFAGIAITDASGHRGTLSSSRWSTTRIIQQRKNSPVLLAVPTADWAARFEAASFDNYWMHEK
jgi:peptidase A4-like protein